MGNCCAAKRDPNEKTVLDSKGKKVDPKKVVVDKNKATKTPGAKPGITKQPNSIVKPKVDPKKPDVKKPADTKKPVDIKKDTKKPTPTPTPAPASVDPKKPVDTKKPAESKKPVEQKKTPADNKAASAPAKPNASAPAK